jgi:hypothetical protein
MDAPTTPLTIYPHTTLQLTPMQIISRHKLNFADRRPYDFLMALTQLEQTVD